MTTTLVTLTGDVTDAIGADFDARRTKAYVRYNTDKVVTDGDEPIHLGGGTVNVESDGTFTLPNVVASTSLVENLQATVYVSYADPTTRQRATATFGPYDLSAETGTVDIRDLEAVQALDPSFASETMAAMQALLAEMEVISGLTGEDAAVALLIDTPSSDTAASLSASIDAKVGVPPINAKAPQWGIAADGVTDDTAAIQALLDYAVDNGRNVYLPRGDYLVSTLVLPMHIEVIGAGLGGYAATGSQAATVLRQRAKVGAEVMGPLLQIVSDDTSGAYNFGPSRLAHLVLRGSASNPTSRAIEFVAADGTKAPIQDTVHYHDILVRGFRGGGFYIPKGARPLVFDTINFLFNGGYGIEMWGKDSSDGSGTPAYLTQAVHFSNISGDANINGLIYLRKFDSGGAVTFTNIKSEKRINPPEGNVAGQADCLIFEDCDNTPIRLNGVSHVSSVVSGATYEPPGAAVVVKGTGKPWISGLTTVAVRVRSTDVAGSPAVLRDDALGYSIAVTATGSDLREDFYGGSGNYKRSGRDLDEALTSGESTLPRDRVFSSTALSTGVLRLSYIRAKKTESIGSIIVPGAGTAAGATPTKIRVGVFEEDETTGDLTLVASSANDTTKFSSATDGVENTFTLSAAFTKIRGKRYAIGALVVTAAAAPTIKTVSGLSAAALAKAPRLSASVTGQTDMPSSVAVGSLSSTSVRVYAELVPA